MEQENKNKAVKCPHCGEQMEELIILMGGSLNCLSCGYAWKDT